MFGKSGLTELKPEGIFRVTIRNPRNQKQFSVQFIVVMEKLTPLLGAAVIQQMDLIESNCEKIAAAKIASMKQQTAQKILDKYRDVLEGDLETLEGLALPCLPPLHHHDECHSPLTQAQSQA